MISLSPGLAQASFAVLNIVARRTHPLLCSEIVAAFPYFGQIDGKTVLATIQALGWLVTDDNDRVTLTTSAKCLLELPNYELRLRQALLDLVDAQNPPWLQSAAFGRSRVLAFAGPGEKQLFVEADLVSSFRDDVVEFWDELATRARGIKDTHLLAIGRKAEKLTIHYEKNRTGVDPKWVSVNNNADGYDVLSIVSGCDTRMLSIEVKGSSRGMAGSLHLTRNEWEMSLNRDCHVFHLWDISSCPSHLAEVSVETMGKHVPSDVGSGAWELLEVPFSAFSSMFKACSTLISDPEHSR